MPIDAATLKQAVLNEIAGDLKSNAQDSRMGGLNVSAAQAAVTDQFIAGLQNGEGFASVGASLMGGQKNSALVAVLVPKDQAANVLQRIQTPRVKWYHAFNEACNEAPNGWQIRTKAYGTSFAHTDPEFVAVKPVQNGELYSAVKSSEVAGSTDEHCTAAAVEASAQFYADYHLSADLGGFCVLVGVLSASDPRATEKGYVDKFIKDALND